VLRAQQDETTELELVAIELHRFVPGDRAAREEDDLAD
jgi:hypothetical protein